MDGKFGDFAHGFPQVLAQSGMGKDQVLEFVAFGRIDSAQDVLPYLLVQL